MTRSASTNFAATSIEPERPRRSDAEMRRAIEEAFAFFLTLGERRSPSPDRSDS